MYGMLYLLLVLYYIPLHCDVTTSDPDIRYWGRSGGLATKQQVTEYICILKGRRLHINISTVANEPIDCYGVRLNDFCF